MIFGLPFLPDVRRLRPAKKKMPSLARKVIICAAVDGLVLQPLSSKRDQRTASPVKIRYGGVSISSISQDLVPDTSKPNSSFEAFGIVGECAGAGKTPRTKPPPFSAPVIAYTCRAMVQSAVLMFQSSSSVKAS